jgi:hypothetical protein
MTTKTQITFSWGKRKRHYFQNIVEIGGDVYQLRKRNDQKPSLGSLWLDWFDLGWF